jgi:hypothetical protein
VLHAYDIVHRECIACTEDFQPAVKHDALLVLYPHKVQPVAAPLQADVLDLSDAHVLTYRLSFLIRTTRSFAMSLMRLGSGCMSSGDPYISP